MRSHLVYLAKAQVPNYFLLIHLTARTTRAFHKPKNCIGKTINQALERIAAQGEKMNDYKSGAQLIAEEIAEEKHGKEFHELSDEQQCEVYGEAMDNYVERHIP